MGARTTIGTCVRCASSAAVTLVLALIAGLLASPVQPARAAGPPGSPFGNFEGANGVSAGIEIKGWTIDPDTSRSIYVWVTIDGIGRHVLANAVRSDVGAAFPAAGAAHGFLAILPADAGTRQVCVTSSNVDRGAHQSLGCRSVTVPSRSPFGNFESVEPSILEGFYVRGWAVDPDVPDGPNFVWVTVDGVGRLAATTEGRPDVALAYPGIGYTTGFLDWIDTTPGPHRVCVTASNAGPGSHTLLGCRTVLVPSGSPIGNADLIQLATNGIRWSVYVKGWTAEPEGPREITWAYLTVNGKRWSQGLPASIERPDVAAAHPAYGPYHGFEGFVEAIHADTPMQPGPNRVCLVAPNRWGSGAETTLGCKILTLPSE